jgi:hypothetical protein
MGLVFLLAKDLQSHQQLCHRCFAFLDQYPDPDYAREVLLTFLAGQIKVTDDPAPAALKWVDKLSAHSPLTGTDRVGLARAMAAYRLGRYEEAIALSELASRSTQLATRCAGQIIRAIALARSGRLVEGSKELRQSEEQLAPNLTTLPPLFWTDLALCRLALDEAHKLFADIK